MLGMQLSADDADTDQSLDTPSVRALRSPLPARGLQSAGWPSPPRMQMLHNEQLPSQKYVHKMDILCFEQEDSSVSGVLPGP